MRGSKFLYLPALAAVLSGCATFNSKDPVTRKVTSEVALSEQRTTESLTLSNLAALERSLNDFIQAKGRIPASLTELIPDYIAEIPEVKLGISDHGDTKRVHVYPPTVILEEQINGAALDDSGGWGYAFNDKQVIIFVDCTHKRIDGSLWYRARGVF